MYMSVFPVCLSVHHLLGLVSMEARRGHQALWVWSYKKFRATIQVLGMELGSSARSTKVLKCCSTSPAPTGISPSADCFLCSVLAFIAYDLCIV